MKKRILVGSLFFMLLLLVSKVEARDYYLVCDPQVGVSSYTLIVNGMVDPVVYPAELDGSVKILLTGYVPGTPYIFELVAVDVSGWGSDLSDPLSATKPVKSLSVRIKSE
ncbi:MAG: hypothetical protein FVQ80_07025 [Planctomycetes bacterium]|nr:hypothetical protein [Planctomycetota bacterium]